MTLFSNYTAFGAMTLLVLGIILFILASPWRNLPTNIDTLVKSLWRLSGPVVVIWAIFVIVLIGTAAYTILLLINHLGIVGTNTDHLRQIILVVPVLITAIAALIAFPETLIRLHYNRRQTLAKEEGLVTDRINAAALGLEAEKTVKVTEDGQVIERTEPNIEVRIGAILVLERIAQNNLDVHIQVMEILCAVVSQNEKPELDLPSIVVFRSDEIHFDPFTIPSIVTQTVLNVIGRRNYRQIEAEQQEAFILDLSYCQLAYFQFTNANFQNVSFRDSILWWMSFDNCDLHNTEFYILHEIDVTFHNCTH